MALALVLVCARAPCKTGVTCSSVVVFVEHEYGNNYVSVITCTCDLPLGGAGGKGTWGKLTEVYEEGGAMRDNRDPNYSSDGEVCCVWKELGEGGRGFVSM